ncbi:hypothetical protein SBV1_100021 [Verrucomicrobia bacterium]|nr:hypothetical protein SBV1_100021 [Verrucomicrobiota bacterium]
MGDPVRLTFAIIPEHNKSVRLYERMENTILIEPLKHSTYRKPPPAGHGKIKRFDLRPDLPLEVQVSGSVKSSGQPNRALVDFGGYGALEVPIGEPIDFYAKAYPAKVRGTDSEEWPFSNHLTITFGQKGSRP